ncbi:MAG: PhoD-like phosphatase N-terminal domain-containing protein, partial [Cytophagaceae bacterium]|nr:PhoD-like phosphatase N-terminal domain-containing protein [Gemmatimonadaceae bacterium]
MTDRRTFLQGLSLLGLGAAAFPGVWRVGRPRSVDDPFTLGVASGDPWPDGVVLWTRLAPDPLHGGGMPAERVPVRWEVARDEGMQQVVKGGTVMASP